jgi:hypothetical protein
LGRLRATRRLAGWRAVAAHCLLDRRVGGASVAQLFFKVQSIKLQPHHFVLLSQIALLHILLHVLLDKPVQYRLRVLGLRRRRYANDDCDRPKQKFHKMPPSSRAMKGAFWGENVAGSHADRATIARASSRCHTKSQPYKTATATIPIIYESRSAIG